MDSHIRGNDVMGVGLTMGIPLADLLLRLHYIMALEPSKASLNGPLVRIVNLVFKA